jgi:hypothetical protein
MPIEKEVSIQLKVKRPDSMALNQAAEQAKKLRREVDGLGQSRALDDAAARAKKFEQQTRAGAMAVTGLVREYAKQGQAAREVDRVTAALVRQGVAADRARTAATRLVSGLSAGARVAERDVQRLATGMNALQRQGMMARPGAGGGLLGQGMGGMLGALGGAGFGAQALSAGFRGIAEAYQSPADETIRRQMSPGMRAAMGYRYGIPVVGQGLQALDAWQAYEQPTGARGFVEGLQNTLTFGPARPSGGSVRGLEESNQRLASQQRAMARARSQSQMFTASDLAARSAQRTGSNSAAMAQAEAAGIGLGARERVALMGADNRAARLFQGLGDEGFGQGDRALGGSLAGLRREVANRPSFGADARFRLGAERSSVMRDLEAAQSDRARAESGQRRVLGRDERTGAAIMSDAGVDRESALQRMAEARQRLIELQGRERDLARATSEAEQQRLDRFRQFAQQAEEHYRRTAQAERERGNSFRENFALMNRLQQRDVLQFSRRLAASPNGQGISTQDLGRFANQDIFRNQIQRILQTRGDASGAQEVLRNAGVQGRIAQAERAQQQAAAVRVQLESQIRAEINTNATAVAEQLSTQLLPQIQQHTAALIAQLQARLDQQLRDERLQQQGAAAGAAGG